MLVGPQQDIHAERDRKFEAARKQWQIRRLRKVSANTGGSGSGSGERPIRTRRATFKEFFSPVWTVQL
jgi:hypothetical protein